MALRSTGERDGDLCADRVLAAATALEFDADAGARALVVSRVVHRLSEYLHQPVLWRKSVDRLCDEYDDAVFIEVGPKTVLSDMLGRRWVRQRILATDGDFPVLSRLKQIQELCSPCSQTS